MYCWTSQSANTTMYQLQSLTVVATGHKVLSSNYADSVATSNTHGTLITLYHCKGASHDARFAGAMWLFGKFPWSPVIAYRLWVGRDSMAESSHCNSGRETLRSPTRSRDPPVPDQPQWTSVDYRPFVWQWPRSDPMTRADPAGIASVGRRPPTTQTDENEKLASLTDSDISRQRSHSYNFTTIAFLDNYA